MLDVHHQRSGMVASVQVFVWRVRPALAPNLSAMASSKPWSEQTNPTKAARKARDGSCTVPQMQEVLMQELGVRKSAVPKWKAQCVEKIFELAKLSPQQATLPPAFGVVAPAAATPAPAVIAAAATDAAAAAVRAEDEADEALTVHTQQQCRVAAAMELEDGDVSDAGCANEPIELETVEVESDAESDDGDGVHEDGVSAAAAGEEVSAAAVVVLEQLVTDFESDPDGATYAVLNVPSIWRCCSSEARTPAWKCGACNLWTHRTCQRGACGADNANPLCKPCFEAASLLVLEQGPRKSRRTTH